MRIKILSGLGGALMFLLPLEGFAIGPEKPTTRTNTTTTTTTTTTKPQDPKPVCKQGFVYSMVRKRCVRTLGEVVPDAELRAQGWTLAEAGEYAAAIALFRMVGDTDDPETLNGLGYSLRKIGLLDQAIGYYRRAIALDPDYLRAREYLGEGYVAAGMPELARAELDEIGRRCGATCEEYVELAAVLAGAEPR